MTDITALFTPDTAFTTRLPGVCIADTSLRKCRFCLWLISPPLLPAALSQGQQLVSKSGNSVRFVFSPLFTPPLEASASQLKHIFETLSLERFPFRGGRSFYSTCCSDNGTPRPKRCNTIHDFRRFPQQMAISALVCASIFPANILFIVMYFDCFIRRGETAAVGNSEPNNIDIVSTAMDLHRFITFGHQQVLTTICLYPKPKNCQRSCRREDYSLLKRGSSQAILASLCVKVLSSRPVIIYTTASE